MKTLLVVKFNNPIIFTSGSGWCYWYFGLLAGEHSFSTPINTRRCVIRWDYHKRPNLGWWKRVKRGEFDKMIAIAGPENSYSRVVAKWNVPDSLYDEITSWCINKIIKSIS